MQKGNNNKIETDDFTDEQKEALRSMSRSKILLPILIGVGVVGYLLWSHLDAASFSKIPWSGYTFFWLFISFLFLVLRHLANAARLYIITQRAFSYWKCVELIFIFEFSTAVTPTQVGGAAVALFVLSQEKLSVGKTASVVIFKVVLDSLFFIITLPFLYLLFGPNMIRPELKHWADLDSWGYVFVTSYIGMFCYSLLFFYGLLINPNGAKRILTLFTKPGFMKKYRPKAEKLGNDFILSSKEIQQNDWRFFLKAIGATFAAWLSKFIMMSCLIVALVPDMSLAPSSQLLLYARLEAMFVIMAFSPTPGGAGFAEVVFGGFLSDFVNDKGTALIAAFIWRLMAYYAYLLIGVIIIPNWLNKVMRKRNKAKV